MTGGSRGTGRGQRAGDASGLWQATSESPTSSLPRFAREKEQPHKHWVPGNRQGLVCRPASSWGLPSVGVAPMQRQPQSPPPPGLGAAGSQGSMGRPRHKHTCGSRCVAGAPREDARPGLRLPHRRAIQCRGSIFPTCPTAERSRLVRVLASDPGTEVGDRGGRRRPGREFQTRAVWKGWAVFSGPADALVLKPTHSDPPAQRGRRRFSDVTSATWWMGWRVTWGL